MSDSKATDAPLPIMLWCMPRSCSTAFERSWMQRQDTRVWHEPLGDPFYYSKDRPCQRYPDSQCRNTEYWDATVEKTMQSLLDVNANNSGSTKKEACNFVFVKDMAQYIFPAKVLRALHPKSTVYRTASSPTTEHFPSSSDQSDTSEELTKEQLLSSLTNPTVIPTELLRCFKHTFLVRTPQKSVPSYWKCVQEKAAGFEFFDGAEAGYEELRLLYNFISNPESEFNKSSSTTTSYGPAQTQPQPPPLIDASVLLAHPEHTLKSYCAALSVPFWPGMLTWESGPVEELSKWGTFHNAAENSTGFKQESEASEEALAAARRGMDNAGATTTDTAPSEAEGKKKKELPAEVADTISASMAAYNYLYARRTIQSPAKQSIA